VTVIFLARPIWSRNPGSPQLREILSFLIDPASTFSIFFPPSRTEISQKLATTQKHGPSFLQKQLLTMTSTAEPKLFRRQYRLSMRSKGRRNEGCCVAAGLPAMKTTSLGLAMFQNLPPTSHESFNNEIIPHTPRNNKSKPLTSLKLSLFNDMTESCSPEAATCVVNRYTLREADWFDGECDDTLPFQREVTPIIPMEEVEDESPYSVRINLESLFAKMVERTEDKM